METSRPKEKEKRDPDLLLYAPPNFEWPRCPEGEKFMEEQLALFLEKHAFARTLQDRMLEETSTRMADWVDHIDLTLNPQNLTKLHLAGFRGYRDEGHLIFWHPHAKLPRVILHSEPWKETVAIKVDSVDDFLRVHHLSPPIEGVR